MSNCKCDCNSVQKFEYYRIDRIDDRRLDELGIKGWELVAVTNEGTYVFKRLKYG